MTSTPPDDRLLGLADWLSAATRREPAALEGLIRFVEPTLRRYLQHRAPRDADADELAQQVLIAALETLTRWAVAADPASWLLAIARNVARQAWRNSAREARRRSRWAGSLNERLAARIDREAGAAEERLAALRDCERRLPERWQAMVDAHYRGQRSLDQIAAEQGIARGTVGATLFRARDRLRRCIESQLAEAQR